MEITSANLKKVFVNMLHRYHVMIFVIFVLGGLVVMVFLLNGIIVQSSNSGDYVPETTQNFDQKTMDRIKELKTRDDPASQLDLSRGRSNPFVE